jgi:hypothetical protein
MAGRSSEAIHGLLHKYKKLDESYAFYAPTPTERGELAVLKQINGYIKKQGAPITVKCGPFTFKNIYGANKIDGTPKADIALVSYNEKTKKFENVCFISHKMGKDASGFQQYSGITPKADGAKSGAISKDKTVVKFLSDISKLHNSIIKNKSRYYRAIKDNKLIGKSIYGPEFGSPKFGIDNIHLIGQGDVKFTQTGQVHKLEWTGHASYNPDVKDFKKDGFTCVVGARYSAGRNFEVNGKTFSGVRVLIMPQKLIGGNADEI